jgi:hypothetical protein
MESTPYPMSQEEVSPPFADTPRNGTSGETVAMMEAVPERTEKETQ